MKITSILSSRKSKNNSSARTSSAINIAPSSQSYTNNNVAFKGLMSEITKKGLKAIVLDLDGTLLAGEQSFRNEIFNFVGNNNKILVYSSARPLRDIQPLIDNKTLVTPDWCVGNSGGNIYKNIGGKLVEVKSWSDQLLKNFDKNKAREIMVQVAQKNMFSNEEWAKIPSEIIPDSQKEFRGSKITEYTGHPTPLNMRLVVAPGVYKKIIKEVRALLKENKIDASVILQHFNEEKRHYSALRAYFDHETALELSNHIIPRVYKDGSYDTIILSANTDKGKATEHIRKSLKIKPSEIFASGDEGSDYPHANKGYVFGQIAGSDTELIKKLERLRNTSNPSIITTQYPGSQGLVDILI